MIIEQHVASFELSQKLKELGFPQDCAFFWCKPPKDFGDKPIVCTGTKSTNYICAAPLSSELSDQISLFKVEWKQHFNTATKFYSFSYPAYAVYFPDKSSYINKEYYCSETDAKALFLIDILKDGEKHAG